MTLIAANPAPYLSIIIGICGLGGLIFTALRYRRDDTASLISQQESIVQGMKTLNDELRLSAERLRLECDDCLRKLREHSGSA